MKYRIIMISVITLILLFLVVLAAGLNTGMRRKLEDIRMASVVYDRNGRVVGNLYHYRRIWAPLSQTADYFEKAVVAAEDARFYRHVGIDPAGIVRAFYHNLKPGGAMEGGSTITQQLAKITLLSQERTFIRKISDIFYALQIERIYTKKEILELYLNSAYLGHGNVGAEAAARYYFEKSADRLSLSESALLAGIIRSPENYSPVKHPAIAVQRRNMVLWRMMQLKMISKSEYRQALSAKVDIVKKTEGATTAGYFLDYIRNWLLEKGFTEEQLRFGGYKIYSTLDLVYQKEAEKTLRLYPENVPGGIQPQGALITLDPESGGILAMVGGRNYGKSQYNRAVYSYRQPGSAIKPFVYTAALEKGYTAASRLEDKELAFTIPGGSEWRPENYDHIFRGTISLREALRNSVNTIAIQLVNDIGVNEVASLMERMGIGSLVTSGSNNDLNLAPLALGGLTRGVTPLELATAYLPFAGQGSGGRPVCIYTVKNKQGKVVKKFEYRKKQVITPQRAYIMTMLMKDVVDQGTGWKAKLPDRPAAGKTGTTSDYTNAWFVGYTPDLLTVVWLGNDRQDQAMKYRDRNIGSTTAAAIWNTYMKNITAGHRPLDFTEPPGIVWADVDPRSGKAVLSWFSSGTYKEVFEADRIPESGPYNFWRKFFSGKAAPQKKPESRQEEPEPITEGEAELLEEGERTPVYGAKQADTATGEAITVSRDGTMKNDAVDPNTLKKAPTETHERP
ncbi:MAG: transglycosylase domain-containing protein [Bacillota bacterium]